MMISRSRNNPLVTVGVSWIIMQTRRWFNAHGLCKHCERYDALLSSRVFEGAEGQEKLDALVRRSRPPGGVWL